MDNDKMDLMTALRLLSLTLLCLLGLLGMPGCSAGPGVAIDFQGSTAVPQVGTGYRADAGLAKDTANGLELISAAGGATLTIVVEAPTQPMQVVVGERHLGVDYVVGSAGWSSNAGSVTFKTLNPYEVTFNAVQMVAAGAGSQGGFTLNGTAIFKR